jgi:hypothetical protein
VNMPPRSVEMKLVQFMNRKEGELIAPQCSFFRDVVI